MFGQLGTIVAFSVSASASLAQTPTRVSWDFRSVPITIEVTRDVPVKRCGFERGALCAQAEFTIPRGDRFQMLEVGLEGGCTIEYRGARYEASSCPWVQGFADQQADIFVIVEVSGSVG
jgi:hypothetical protein